MFSSTLFAISLFLLLSTHLSTSTTPTEKKALMDLYEATAGKQWLSKDNWGQGDPCTHGWYGITCKNHIVRTIWLFGNNLQGTLPESIGSFPGLEELQLSSNAGLSGTLPESIGKLSSLKFLFLSANGLEGTIPGSIGYLSSLIELQIDKNELLRGSIPETMGHLVRLKKLWLSNNNLNGTIPYCLGDLTHIQFLVLSYNRFSGTIPPSLGELSQLEELWITNNNLIGTIPIGNLASLKNLWLSNNQLTGTISPKIGRLSSLEELYLSNNRLSGPLPPELGQLRALNSLVLNVNLFTGTLPDALAKLSSLEILKISKTRLCGGCFPFPGTHSFRICDIEEMEFGCNCVNPPCHYFQCTKELTCENVNPENDNLCVLSDSMTCEDHFWGEGSDYRLELRQKLKANHTIHLMSSFLTFKKPLQSLLFEVKKLKKYPNETKHRFIEKKINEWSNSFPPEKNKHDLTIDEIQAIGLYTFNLGVPGMDFYQFVNSILQELNSTKWEPLQGYLYYMFKGLNKLPNIQKIVYKGIPLDMKTEIQNKYTLGQKIHWSVFSSTSDDLDLAKSFAGPNGIIMRIQVLTGKHIQDYSVGPHPNEILLSPRMTFMVTTELRKEEDGYLYLSLQEIDGRTHKY
eukprot:TRINITY_DN11889_c0_g1_i1.p1 TRINITY_DN11889_c0_g1~~TRINITY_DN11889_c0_g1_i1.p1  ORF type:complete len:630 (-),score=129.69 TRINITY_DN11889_c0_g1_i1:104-1993(-)